MLKDRFSVIVFLNLINTFDLDENLFISELEKIINIYNIKPLISFINKKQIILNLFLPKNDNSFINSNEFSSLLYSINDYINKFTPLYICIGNVVNSIYNIKSSYKNLCKVVNSTFFYNYNSIIYFDKFIESTYILDDTIYDKFENSLSNEDKDGLISLINNLTCEIKGFPNTSISYVKDIYYKLLLKLINFSKDRKIDLSNSLDSNNFFEDILQFNNIFDINYYLLDKINDLFNILDERNKNDKPILNILKFIHENYSNVNLSLEEISKNIFLTPAHICVIFKDYTNTTVNKYITEYRLDKAKKLLKDPSIKMNEIASRVGYRDGNYFAKTFKKETGYSPSEYRRKFV